MTEISKTTASREINATPQDIFDLLSNPERHAETDHSGSVVSTDKGERLKKVGDTFRMNMVKGDGSQYQTDNEVFAFVENRVIGWQNLKNVTSDVEVGSKWLYELEPVDATTTKLSLTYDPSEITNPQVQALAKEKFAIESNLEASLAKIAEVLA
ncbi:SRPBCC family protein [Luteococcus sp. Sow4_B9]|uniref:SRPBCC family protein n=1 Tax=Luteococcus sp. Sow4_B9 TaxID=3438792 RepID=UPI003F99DAF6